MKKSPGKIAFLILLLTTMAVPAFGQGRTATIDLRKVFDNYWKRKEADSQLKERTREMDKDLKGLIEDYKKLKDDYTKLQSSATDAAVAAEERDRRKKAAEAKLLEIRESEQNIENFNRQAKATLDEQMRRMRERILGEIKTAVTSKAKTAGYATVFDVSAESINGTPVLIFNNGENDITDEVLTQINATAPVDTPAVPPARTEKPAKSDKPACGSHGTTIDFVDTPNDAAKQAKKEEKLVFVLHVSGYFEDPRFT